MGYPFPMSTTSSKTPQEFIEAHVPSEPLSMRVRVAGYTYKAFAVLYVAVMLLVIWNLRPGSSIWSTQQSDRIPYSISQSHGGMQE
jgi:hypothetical protein